ncbi:MAG: ATP-binding cassette domain-containing protein [Pseudomonadota bacterium]
MHAIQVENVRFQYADEAGVSVDRFDLEAGKSVAVLGPSGCGKSTFLHLLAGLLSPQEGAIRLLDQDLASMNAAAVDRFRGANLGLVMQRLHLIKALTVRENIELAIKLGRSDATAPAINALLERLDIGDVAHQKPSTLSQGQAQRTAIARALVNTPRIVLADEPTSALDDANAAEAIALLKAVVADSGAALLVVTHDQRIRGTLDHDFDFPTPP